LTGFVLFQKTIMCSSRHNVIHCFVHIFFHWSFLMRCCERNQCPIWAACISILPEGTRVGFKSLRSNLQLISNSNLILRQLNKSVLMYWNKNTNKNEKLSIKDSFDLKRNLKSTLVSHFKSSTIGIRL
jgi:hypothetical protein